MFPGFKKAPEFVRGTAGMGLCYLLAILVMGSWKEARLLMPLYPVIIPLGFGLSVPGGKRNNLYQGLIPGFVSPKMRSIASPIPENPRRTGPR
jgi:hypothetical protein